ncbi:MAG TPA: macro domain-containing protein [Gaiellaceae bacterium]
MRHDGDITQQPHGGRIAFVRGDLAGATVDAIVNPTSPGFEMGFTGVNGALLSAGGVEYARECDRLRTAARIGASVTLAGRLSARYVIHAVSPVWRGGAAREHDALRRAHELVLDVAASLDCRTVALPAIGCGAHRFPSEAAGAIAVNAVATALARHPGLERIEFHFTNRSVLHDYAIHWAGSPSRDSRLQALRDGIVENLRAGGEPELGDALARVDDEPTLQAIDDTAHAINAGLTSESSTSVSLASIYATAVQQVLGEVLQG